MRMPKINRNIMACIAVFLIRMNVCFSQDEKEVSWRDRFFFGGNFGLQFGSITDIEIAPLAGYRLTPDVSAGMGLKYEYYKQDYYNISFKTAIYGGSLFVSYTFLRDALQEGLGFMLQAEDEALSLEKRYFTYAISESDKSRFVLNSVLLGGGIKQHLGGRSSMYLLVLWNLNQTTLSPYSSPVFRVGINF